MESAIPQHLMMERTQPVGLRPDWQPPYPSFVARFAPSVTRVAMAYFGVQYRSESEPPAIVRTALADLTAASANTDGPSHLDRARYIDEAGYHTVLSIAYWDDLTRHERWFATARQIWLDDQHARHEAGFFVEAVRPSTSRFETLFSNDRIEGVAHLADALSGEVAEHAYWGGARDRLPLAQTNPLEPGNPPIVINDGIRRVVRGQHNLCLIRSGQDWADTGGDERRMYLHEIEPVLHAGMDFLRDHGHTIGCYANRYLQLIDENGNTVDKSFGMSWWRSLADLDRWAKDHHTHKAIYGQAVKYLSTLGSAARLRLYHEVTVAAADEQHFEYLGCHPNTGMLRVSASEEASSLRTNNLHDREGHRHPTRPEHRSSGADNVVDLTCQHKNQTLLVEGPELMIRPVGTRPQSMRGRFSADQLQTMINLYKSGATAEQIAQTSGFSKRSVKRLLQQHGIRRERRTTA